jgi:hypothetical protein
MIKKKWFWVLLLVLVCCSVADAKYRPVIRGLDYYEGVSDGIDCVLVFSGEIITFSGNVICFTGP